MPSYTFLLSNRIVRSPRLQGIHPALPSGLLTLTLRRSIFKYFLVCKLWVAPDLEMTALILLSLLLREVCLIQLIRMASRR